MFLSGDGLLMGNQRDRGYFQIEARTGNVYSTGMSIVNGTLRIHQADVIESVNIRGRAVTVPTARSEGGSVAGISHEVPNNNGAWVTTYITGSTFIPPGAGGGLGGFLTITLNGNPCWIGAGVPGSTVTGTVVMDLPPGWHSIGSAGTFGGSNTSIFALSCQR
jgi:hypothetical protein